MGITNPTVASSDRRFELNITRANAELRSRHPAAIIEWAIARARRPVVSTNFRPLAASLLHMVAQVAPRTPVLWVDTGYNTPATYRFAAHLVAALDLNLQVYAPRMTRARREAILGGVPTPSDPAHVVFTREVKLEPFERALQELEVDFWLTGIRHDQTDFRRTLDVISRGPAGTLRVAPLFHWTEVDLEGYLHEHGLPDNDDYIDPTKVRADRECGLQTLS